MKRRYLLFGILVMVSLVLVACQPAAQPTEAPPPTEPPPPPTEAMDDDEMMLPDLGGREITIAVENGYLPFNYINPNTGVAEGWDYDFINLACERLNCTPVYVEFAWDPMIASVAEGQFDMAADGITITEDRAQVVDFSIGYAPVQQRLLVQVGEGRFSSIEDFVADEDAILGVQIGTTNYEVATRYLGDDRIITFDGFGETVQSLVNGDTDGVIIDAIAGEGYISANKDALKLVGASLSDDELGFIFPKGSDLVEVFNAVIEEFRADGTMAQLEQKWFTDEFRLTYDDIFPEEEVVIGTEDNPIVWVLVPSQDTEAVLTGADEIAAAVEEQTGLIMEPLVTTDYTGAVEAMCSGEAQVGALNTFNYVLAHERGCADVALASVRFGSTFYSGQLITRADSGITSIADFAGKTFCRPDPTSTSGWVIPSIAMQAAGLDPEADLAEIIDAGGHDAVVIAVYNGDCDAGSTFVDARSNVEEDFTDVNDVVVVIEESAPIPNDTISVHPDVPEDIREQIVGVFLDLTTTDEGLEILNTVYSWSGMEVVEDSFYDGFRQQLEAAGLDIQELTGG